MTWLWWYWLVVWPLLFCGFVGVIAWSTNRHELRHGIKGAGFGAPRIKFTKRRKAHRRVG